jgi:hypothetical protein
MTLYRLAAIDLRLVAFRIPVLGDLVSQISNAGAGRHDNHGVDRNLLVVVTHNLAIGVLVGVPLSGIFYA